MKKFLIALLALVLIISVFTIAVGADGGVQIVVTADKPTVYPGQTITYTLSVKNSGVAIVNLSFDFSLPAGIEFTATESSDVSGFAYHNINLHPAPGTGNPTVTLSSGSKSGDFTIGTITGTVTNTVEVKTYSFTVSNIVTTQGGGETSDTSGASVTVSHGDKDSSYHNYPLSPTSTVPPTCQEYGKEIYECQTKGCNAIDEKSIAKKEHRWEDTPTWNWGSENPPFDNVTATLICSGNGGNSHTVEATAKGEKIKSTATCTEPGDTTYAATVTFGTGDKGNGKSYTDTKTVKGVALGHKWGEPSYEWDTKDPSKATLTVTCENDGCAYHTEPYTETVTATKSGSKEATCETDGSIDYTATFKVADQPEAGFSTKNHVVVPATGHEWPETITEGTGDDQYQWTKTEGGYTAVAKVKCVHPNCEEYYKEPAELKGSVTKVTTAPTCLTAGKNVYTVTFETPDYETDAEHGMLYDDLPEETEEIAATGHTIGEVSFDWKDADGKEKPTGVTATATCTNEKCDSKGTLTAKTVTVEEVKGDKDWSEPSYEESGIHTFKASATFADIGEVGKDETKTDEEFFVIPQLEAKVETPSVNNETSIGQTVDKDALQAHVQSLVEKALSSDTCPSGMEEDLYDLIRQAGTSTDNNDLTVNTELVIQESDRNDPPSNVTIDEIYTICIKVTVTSKELEGNNNNTIGYITETADPITFTVPLSSGGPIWYVMTNHSGTWAKIEGSKVENGNIVFSSKQFSDFAIISSNDLKDAKIEAIPAQTYTGKAITPKVKVTINGGQELTENEDYTVTYSNNTDKGTAKVTIEAVEGSDYTGSNTANFQIKAASSGGSGSGSGNGSGSGSPETGDETPLALYAALLTASLAALAATLLVLRKQRQK